MGGKRFVIPPLEDPWFITVNGWGDHVIRDRHGFAVLRHPDAVRQLHNVYLASSAPLLRHALALAANRLMTMDGGWHRDDLLVNWCWYAAHDCSPPAAEAERVASAGDQVNLYFEEAA